MQRKAAMNAEISDFFGVWSLLPDSCDYGDLPPPGRAAYTVLPDGEQVAFWVAWTDADGQRLQAQYRCFVDGAPADIGDGQQLRTWLEDGALISEVQRGGEVQHHQVCTLIENGQTMRVTQRATSADGDALTVTADYSKARIKQVMAYRRDLKMRKGKIAAQCAHASMAVFFQRDEGDAATLRVPLDGPMAWWSRRGFAKVVLSVDDETALLQAWEAAKAAGLPTALITDSGRTEFHGVPTRTTVAIGPAIAEEIDAITGPGGLVNAKLA